MRTKTHSEKTNNVNKEQNFKRPQYVCLPEYNDSQNYNLKNVMCYLDLALTYLCYFKIIRLKQALY